MAGIEEPGTEMRYIRQNENILYHILRTYKGGVGIQTEDTGELNAPKS